MGNNEFSISESVRSQWGERVQEGRRIFFNKITLEQFSFIVISSSKIRTSVPQLVHRSIYPLPNTPKVIILNDIRGEISILAQHPHCPLSVIFGQLVAELQFLHLLQKTVLALRGLFLRFGAFYTSAEMLAADHRGQPMVWINSCFEHDHIQNPLPHISQPEQTMVAQTAILLRSMLRGELIYHKMFTEAAGNFAAFLQTIEDAIRDERNAINSKKPQCKPKKSKWKPVLITPQLTLSSENSLLSLNDLKIQINDKKKQFANNVPKFIKRIKDKHNMSPSKVISGDRGRKADKHHEKQGVFGKYSSKLAKVRSLNGSPESNKMNSTLMSTANSFNQPQGRLFFSRHQHKAAANTGPMSYLELPLINSLKCTEMASDKLIPEVSEEESTWRQITFNGTVPSSSSGILNNYCKSMSQSRQLHTSMARILEENQNLSLQVNPQMNESVVIHGGQGSGTQNGNYLALYQEIGKVLF